MLQLPLGKGIEKIALVLPGVQGLFQKPASRLAAIHPSIVSGGHVEEARRFRRLQQPGEFQAAIALHAGVWSTAGLVYPDKRVYDAGPEFLNQVQRREGDPQALAYGPGVGDVLSAISGQQLHGDPLAAEALRQRQMGRHRAIHPAAHGN